MKFRFTPIPDKTNDFIFLKSPITLFLILGTILVIFAQWGLFWENLALTHNYIGAPNTVLRFRKNQWANSEKTCRQTDRRKDRRTKGRTDRPYLIGPFQPRPRSKKLKFKKNLCISAKKWSITRPKVMTQ